MAIDEKAVTRGAVEHDGAAGPPPADEPSAAAVQEALAGLAAQSAAVPQPRLGEMKWRLTVLLFPAILLVFIALYVSSIASGVEVEVGLLWAGGASIALAMLGRAAVGILGDDTRLVLDDNQIVAMARSGAVRDYLARAGAEPSSDGASQPTTVTLDGQSHEEPTRTAQMAGPGGKE